MPPRTGLNVPIVTALDDAGNFIEADQRRIIQYTIQQGRGADSLFIAGTTGEYNRLSQPQVHRLLEVGVDEIRQVNQTLPKEITPVETWVGITAPTKNETIELLELAIALKAEVGVFAPYAIDDLESSEVVAFFEREISPRIVNSSLIVSLYDNPDIAAAHNAGLNVPHELVAALGQMPSVVGLKASATRQAFGNYAKDFAGGINNSFTLYAGNAGLIFEIDEIQRENGIENAEVAIAGVVSGTANVFPREWREAWQSVVAHDREKIEFYKKFFEDFVALTGFPGENGYSSKLIGGIKQAMLHLGIISSAAVASGTPQLTADEAGRLNEGLDKLLSETKFSSEISAAKTEANLPAIKTSSSM